MTKKLLWGVAATAAASMPLVASADANLKLLSSWNKSNWPTYVVVDEFQKRVHKASNNKIKITISGPEVVPPFEQLQPVSAGVFDMLFTHGVYHAGSKGLALVVDAIENNPKKRRDVGIIDAVDKYYQKNNNVKLVALVSSSNAGYHMFLKKPLSPEGDVRGRKIRGTQSYHGVIRALGGSPVVLPGGEIYTALEKGVIDGACWPAAGMLSMKHYEVAKYRVRPTFGSSNLPILVNLAKWRKLSKTDQNVLTSVGKKLEIDMPAIGDKILDEETAELRKYGVNDITLAPDKVKLVNKVWNESLWDVANKCCGDGAKSLRALAKKNGMTN